MWRLCDLHNHTTPNEKCSDAWNAEAWIESCLDAGLDVAAVTDHDHCNHISEAISAASGTSLVVIPGVEVSTDRGHVLVLAPGDDGTGALTEFVSRAGVRPESQVDFDHVAQLLKEYRTTNEAFNRFLVAVGSHVDIEGSLLGPSALQVERQLQLANQLHALEVCRDEVREEWIRTGVKQRSTPTFALLRGSDTHDNAARRNRATWIYLPDVTVRAFRHAFAVPEASIRFDKPPEPPETWLESVDFSGGHHGGIRFDFCERSNAVIGPPNSGKSLVIDALKFVFGITSGISEVDRVSEARMRTCLPPGTTVDVRVRTGASTQLISRTVGAPAGASPPFKVIIFSQTELTRRGMAPTPAIQLLDLHCESVSDLQRDVAAKAPSTCATARSTGTRHDVRPHTTPHADTIPAPGKTSPRPSRSALIDVARDCGLA
jgi:hypothetical protein